MLKSINIFVVDDLDISTKKIINLKSNTLFIISLESLGETSRFFISLVSPFKIELSFLIESLDV